MCTFLENPLLELTNNAAERAVRPVVMGRKNWLFANTEAGARAVSVIFSVIETAKANFLKPYKYLNWLFDRIRAVDFNSFEDLLLWSIKLPENLRLEEA
ncbi:MAG TPA: IS66 family transposase [Clostridiales bacterium]|nr:IS66 family transposase [Clostridiales bacterium]